MTSKVENDRRVSFGLGFLAIFALAFCLTITGTDLAAAQDDSSPAETVGETVAEVVAEAETATEAALESVDEAAEAVEAVAELDSGPAAEEADSEEPDAEEPGTDGTNADEPADPEAETAAEESEAEDIETPEVESTADESDETADESESDEAVVADDAGSSAEGYLILAIVIALFVVPMFLGNFLAKNLRMPDHGWKFALAIGTLAGAAVVFAFGEVKFGPDLSGGITLIYELQDASLRVDDEASEDEEDADADALDKDKVVEELITALTERVDPSGTKEVTIRKYGAGQIEIIIPKAKQEDLEYIERRIYTAGSLEFRITASPKFAAHKDIIDKAKRLPKGVNELLEGGLKIAEWVSYDLEQFGPVDGGNPDVIKRMAGREPQALVLTDDGQDVTGDELTDVQSGFGQTGGPIVTFKFNTQGAFKFDRLTGEHLPSETAGPYRLGILLDKRLLSAPQIQARIKYSGEITGLNSAEEAEFLAKILNAGKLPAQLNKEPIFRETISPTLGAETVRKGRTAITISLIAVMVFMLFYYRFAGFVACLALAANLLLILGLMVLFKAAFTLPGLAGLVLTIGMSVDANVLIFERIREERKRGAAMRMAIINGFARATQTIVDANVTTLITAIVIYRIAPDNVKGFGVTLILGIIMSMYSAIFLSRIVFDICERTRSLKELKMMQIISSSNVDFIGKRVLAGIFSLIVITVGLISVNNRRDDLLNIDFTGGSSVTMVFDDDQPLPYADVKQALDETELVDKNLSLVEVGQQNSGLRYTVKSVDDDVNSVQALLQETFGDRLKTYSLEISDTAQIAESSATEAADEDSETPAISDRFAGGTVATLSFSGDDAVTDPNQPASSASGVSFETVSQMIADALQATEHSAAAWEVSNDEYSLGSVRRFPEWQVKLALNGDEAAEVWQQMKSVTDNQPIFPLANAIGGRVAGDLSSKAIAAIVTSLLGIVAYIWFRFQRMIYGFAAVIALVHDVLVTLGFIAVSAVVVQSIPGLAEALMIEKFQISLPIVAAFLTIIGYSLNDTIVVFDRIREVKGKSPDLTADMINSSINQTLSRTLLTSATTLLSVILLYTLGGDGIHGFAFALVIGVIVGTYSSIFIASPALLWMSQMTESKDSSPQGSKAA